MHAVLADGQISTRERKLLGTYAQQVNLSTADVKMAISRECRRAYQQARRELRRSRKSGKSLST